jgi:hypothetical protein
MATMARHAGSLSSARRNTISRIITATDNSPPMMPSIHSQHRAGRTNSPPMISRMRRQSPAEGVRFNSRPPRPRVSARPNPARSGAPVRPPSRTISKRAWTTSSAAAGSAGAAVNRDRARICHIRGHRGSVGAGRAPPGMHTPLRASPQNSTDMRSSGFRVVYPSLNPSPHAERDLTRHRFSPLRLRGEGRGRGKSPIEHAEIP